MGLADFLGEQFSIVKYCEVLRGHFRLKDVSTTDFCCPETAKLGTDKTCGW